MASPIVAAHRIDGFGTSIFTEISRLASLHNAVNLGQGFPDFSAPEFVKQAARAAIAADFNQYAPSAGQKRLRNAIAAHWQRQHGDTWDPETEITVTQGATEALLAATLGILNPGDEAVIFEPFYDAYVPDVQMAGGTARFVRLHPPHWNFDHEELASAFSPRTKLIFLNSPHNPTGKVFSVQELDAIAALANERDAVVIADEVYSQLTYG